MNYFFLQEARKELNVQIYYYNERRSGLGNEFFSEIVDAIGQIIDNPELWPTTGHKDARKLVLDRFPFKVIYQFKPTRNEIRIIAIAHGARRPFYWRERT